MNQRNFQVQEIGKVDCSNGFQIQLAPEFMGAMEGLEGFQYVQVIWWAHELDDPEYRKITTMEKPYKRGPEVLGTFATRSPVRPNPLLLTAAPVVHLDKKNGVIHLAYIDASQDSPVLDIKPYHPATERIKSVKVPKWCDHWPKWYEDSAQFDWMGEFENAQ